METLESFGLFSPLVCIWSFSAMLIPITITSLVFSLITAYIASHKGRNALGWFFLCFIFGLFWSSLIILIIILILPNLNEEYTKLAQEGAWRRRHQEGFEQERNVNRHFRDHVIKRLDRQDEVLGLPPIEDRIEEMPLPPKEIVTYPMLGNGSWYIVVDGRETGPMSEEDVVERLESGEINGDTYAWSEGMQDWQRTRTIGNFTSYC
jgi:uncharacterized membrane protein